MTEGCRLIKPPAKTFLADNMPRLIIVAVACVALFLSACASTPQSLILGKWEAASASVDGVDAGSAQALNTIKMTAEFAKDGTAKITMFGRTMQGTYKLSPDNELEWTVGGITTKSKVSVTATKLEVTDDANRTIKYKRK
jgi:hypothetical protein